MRPMDIAHVNSLVEEQFEWAFGNVIELCTDAAKQVEKRRPFADVAELCDGFSQYLDDLSESGKVAVLNLHPDLAGILAYSGQLTWESAGEQQAAGLQTLSTEEKESIDYLNHKYQMKFGFPFVICAREHKVQSIIEGLQRRYNHTQQQEIHAAVEEVKEICRLRILDIVQT